MDTDKRIGEKIKHEKVSRKGRAREHHYSGLREEANDAYSDLSNPDAYHK